jgi:subtilisin family serine protease
MINHQATSDPLPSSAGTAGLPPAGVKPVEPPLQREEAFLAELLQASRLVRLGEARSLFQADGTGTAIAVLDTGLRSTHRDFAGRLAAQRNFTAGNGADPADAADGHGHGTNVAGIICAGGVHRGVAPAAQIVALKVLADDGSGRFEDVAAALQWVIDHHRDHGITALCLAFSDGGNHRSDAAFAGDSIARRIEHLAELGIAACAAAGDDYYTHRSVQGMCYPAILRDALSVGAVYDGDLGPLRHSSGAEAYETRADRITPFSQRLHEKVGRRCATDIFAPGAPMVASGILGDGASSIQSGTSQATPVAAGLVLLLQSLCLRSTGSLPSVPDLRRWLIGGGVAIVDSDDEHDNVLHTGLAFSRVDAVASLDACAREIAGNALQAAAPALHLPALERAAARAERNLKAEEDLQ